MKQSCMRTHAAQLAILVCVFALGIVLGRLTKQTFTASTDRSHGYSAPSYNDNTSVVTKHTRPKIRFELSKPVYESVVIINTKNQKPRSYGDTVILVRFTIHNPLNGKVLRYDGDNRHFHLWDSGGSIITPIKRSYKHHVEGDIRSTVILPGKSLDVTKAYRVPRSGKPEAFTFSIDLECIGRTGFLNRDFNN